MSDVFDGFVEPDNAGIIRRKWIHESNRIQYDHARDQFLALAIGADHHVTLDVALLLSGNQIPASIGNLALDAGPQLAPRSIRWRAIALLPEQFGELAKDHWGNQHHSFVNEVNHGVRAVVRHAAFREALLNPAHEPHGCPRGLLLFRVGLRP